MNVACTANPCDWNMHHWHGDMPGMGHGHAYYNCPYRGEAGEKDKAMPGASLFQEKGCAGCHTIGAGDKTGPDLAGLFQRRDEKWVREFIQDPTKKLGSDKTATQLQAKYQVAMPQLELTQQELEQIVQYLKSATQ